MSECADTIIVAEDTVLNVVLPGTPVVEDTGPLHGTWGVFAEGDVPYLDVFIIDDASGEFTGHLTTQDAFCSFVGQESGCPEGQLDKPISRVSGGADRMFMILNLTDNPNKDQIEFTMNANAGTGQLANPSAVKFEGVTVRRLE